MWRRRDPLPEARMTGWAHRPRTQHTEATLDQYRQTMRGRRRLAQASQRGEVREATAYASNSRSVSNCRSTVWCRDRNTPSRHTEYYSQPITQTCGEGQVENQSNGKEWKHKVSVKPNDEQRKWCARQREACQAPSSNPA